MKPVPGPVEGWTFERSSAGLMIAITESGDWSTCVGIDGGALTVFTGRPEVRIPIAVVRALLADEALTVGQALADARVQGGTHVHQVDPPSRSPFQVAEFARSCATCAPPRSPMPSPDRCPESHNFHSDPPGESSPCVLTEHDPPYRHEDARGRWFEVHRQPRDQPLPVPNGEPAIWDLVIADMRERDRVGRERYGTPLQAFNGRDALVDAYEEALDKAVYLRQAIEERRRQPPLSDDLVELLRAAAEAHEPFMKGRLTEEESVLAYERIFHESCRLYRWVRANLPAATDAVITAQEVTRG